MLLSRRDGMSGGEGNALVSRDLAQQIRMIGNDAIDADVDHPRDILGRIHRPDHDLEPELVRLGNQRRIDVAKIGRPDRASRRLDGAGKRSAVVGRIEACRPFRRLVEGVRRARALLQGQEMGTGSSNFQMPFQKSNWQFKIRNVCSKF